MRVCRPGDRALGGRQLWVGWPEGGVSPAWPWPHPPSRNYDVAAPHLRQAPSSLLHPLSICFHSGRSRQAKLGSCPDPYPSPCPLPHPSPRAWSPLSRSHASPPAAPSPPRTLRCRLPARLEQASWLGPGQSGGKESRPCKKTVTSGLSCITLDVWRMTAESAEGGETLRHPGCPLLPQPGDEIPPWSRP